MAERTYVAEVTDPVSQETTVLEAPTEEELEQKLENLLPDDDPAADGRGGSAWPNLVSPDDERELTAGY